MRFLNLSRKTLLSVAEWTTRFERFKLKAIIFSATLICVSTLLFAQTKSFEFLNLSDNATPSALGGVNVSSRSNCNFFVQFCLVCRYSICLGFGYLFYPAKFSMDNNHVTVIRFRSLLTLEK